MSKFVATSAPKCPVCNKSVYKMEEMLALNQSWHKSCFTCGLQKGDGCGRTLQKGTFVDHQETPYCNTCYNKNFKLKGFGYGANLSSESSKPPAQPIKPVSSSSAAPVPQNRRGSGGSMGLAAMIASQNSASSGPGFISSGGSGSGSGGTEKKAPSFSQKEGRTETAEVKSLEKAPTPSSSKASSMKPTFGGSPKCPICSKSVYKMEEILALNQSWHKLCFTCGLQKGDGCGRTLQKGAFLDHQETPYCNSCYNKNFKPKGFGYGANLSSEVPKPAVSNSVSESKQNVRQSSGGSAALAARLSETSVDDAKSPKVSSAKTFEKVNNSTTSTSSSNDDRNLNNDPSQNSCKANETAVTEKQLKSSSTREARVSIGAEFQGDGDEVDESEW